MSKYMKFICISVLMLIVCFTFTLNTSYAKPSSQFFESMVEGGGNGGGDSSDASYSIVDPDFYKPTDKGGNNQLIDLGNVIIGALQVFGTIAAVVTIMVIGIRYMMGSASEKASYKETMIPYIIGAIMLFAIPNILAVILDLVNGIDF